MINRLPVPAQLFIFCFVQSGKRIVEAKTRADQLGYALGGACGSMVAILFSKVWFGQ